jgi:uncharacterized protein YecE (DUF72 family)
MGFERSPRDVAVGCCGWGEARARYFTHFPVVELQDTFYQMPSPALATKWRAAAPADFEFCMKAWQLVTHTPASPTYRRLKAPISPEERNRFGSFRPTEQVWRAWERTQEIARVVHATIILFQCPGSFHPTLENIRNFRTFFNRADREGRRLAWEPRGEWPAELIRELCAEFDLTHCVDPFKDSSIYGGLIYWRLHGRNGYRYVYSDDELKWLEQQIQRCKAEGRGPAYLLFNNMAMKNDALRFQHLLGNRQ